MRCRAEISSGAFVCEYAGEVLTESEAAARCVNSGDDDYIFSLDHFDVAYQKPKDEDLNLGVDARVTGGVARFINHHSEPNLIIQSVFTPGAEGCRANNQRLYRICLFAGRDIGAMEELTYDYGEDTYWKHISKDVDVVDGAGVKRTRTDDDDDDDAAPLPSSRPPFSPSPEMTSSIVEMGFSRAQARVALVAIVGQSIELAMEWLLTHPEEAAEADANADADATIE